MTGVLLVLLPFYQGGLIGMANEALAGHTQIRSFIQAGKSNYISLLLSYLVILAVNILFGIAGFVLFFAGGLGFVIGNGQPSTAVIAIIGILGLLIVVAYLLIVISIQFYAHAIVLSDTNIIEGFKYSVKLVRQNLFSVAGYSVIMFFGGALIGLLGGVSSILFSPQPALGTALPDISLPLVILILAISLILTAIFGAFYGVYSVAFYQKINPD
jgi:hypothetical protein